MDEIREYKSDSFGYKGTVEIGFIVDGKKFKITTSNAGKFTLFEFLCKCLVAKINPNTLADTADRPGNLIILDENNNSILSYGIGFSDLRIEGYNNDANEDSTDSTCSVIFNFLVPGASIYGKSVKNVKLCSIANKDIIYATASFNDAITTRDVDTNLYVSWRLTISNR